MVEFWWGPSFSNFSLYPQMAEQREEASSLFNLIRFLIPFMRAPPSWPHLILIFSQKSHLLIPSPWELRFQYMNLEGGGLGGHKHSDYSSSQRPHVANYLLAYSVVLATYRIGQHNHRAVAMENAIRHRLSTPLKAGVDMRSTIRLILYCLMIKRSLSKMVWSFGDQPPSTNT